MVGGSDDSDGTHFNEEGNYSGLTSVRTNHNNDSRGVLAHPDYPPEDHLGTAPPVHDGHGEGDDRNCYIMSIHHCPLSKDTPSGSEA